MKFKLCMLFLQFSLFIPSVSAKFFEALGLSALNVADQCKFISLKRDLHVLVLSYFDNCIHVSKASQQLLSTLLPSCKSQNSMDFISACNLVFQVYHIVPEAFVVEAAQKALINYVSQYLGFMHWRYHHNDHSHEHSLLVLPWS